MQWMTMTVVPCHALYAPQHAAASPVGPLNHSNDFFCPSCRSRLYITGDHLMKLRLPLSGKRHATILSAYAPTMTNPDEVKDKFYDNLDSVISAAPQTDKLILLGDFNARVGTDHQTWEGVNGSEGVGKCNSNGLLLLRKCAEHELLITNTVFHLPTRRKTTWMHPRSKHWHLIDYVIVQRRDRQDV